MEDNKTYQCTVGMSYIATDPVDAANQLIANIQTNPNWYVEVREIKPDGTVDKKSVTVDTETGEISD